jgi:hypothetical protein
MPQYRKTVAREMPSFFAICDLFIPLMPWSRRISAAISGAIRALLHSCADCESFTKVGGASNNGCLGSVAGGSQTGSCDFIDQKLKRFCWPGNAHRCSRFP